jgi:hypothetical protein
MCFPNFAESTTRKAPAPPSPQPGPTRGVSSSSTPLDPLAELNAIQSSLSTLQRHYRTMKKHAHDNVSAPDSALYQDALLGSNTLEAFFIGPTHSSTTLYNYFDVSGNLSGFRLADHSLVLSRYFRAASRPITRYHSRS